jgi:hypothetical protein
VPHLHATAVRVLTPRARITITCGRAITVIFPADPAAEVWPLERWLCLVHMVNERVRSREDDMVEIEGPAFPWPYGIETDLSEHFPPAPREAA